MKASGHLCIDQLKLSPSQEWVDERNAWRFLRLTRGSGYWLDPAKPRLFCAGEMAVCGPQVKAVVRASQLNEICLHGFCFMPELLGGILTLAERHFFETSASSTAQTVQFIPSTHPVNLRFAELVNHSAQGRDLEDRAQVLGLVAIYFGESIARHEMPDLRGVSAQRRFRQLISQMPDLEVINHTTDQLAALCGCSPRHFSRLFRAHFGKSPRTRLTELRMLKARQLLATTDEAIPQVALDSGYRSLSLFSSLFKRKFGMTPLEWRQQGGKNPGKLF